MLFNLAHYGLIKISGIDAKKLLQGQMTCNLDDIESAQTRMGALCNPQGRVLSLFHIFTLNHAYYLLLLKSLVPTTLQTLKKFAIFYQTELSDVSEDFSILGQITTDTQAVPEQMIIKIPVGIHRNFIISSQANKLASDELAWKKYNINENIPTIYPETIGKLLPHEINLPALGAISFNKGCYTGQEIIARMHYRGKLKNHLYSATIQSDQLLSPGDAIYYLQNHQPHECGIIIDACLDGDNYRALIVADEKNARDEHLFLQHNPQIFFTSLKRGE